MSLPLSSTKIKVSSATNTTAKSYATCPQMTENFKDMDNQDFQQFLNSVVTAGHKKSSGAAMVTQECPRSQEAATMLRSAFDDINQEEKKFEYFNRSPEVTSPQKMASCAWDSTMTSSSGGHKKSEIPEHSLSSERAIRNPRNTAPLADSQQSLGSAGSSKASSNASDESEEMDISGHGDILSDYTRLGFGPAINPREEHEYPMAGIFSVPSSSQPHDSDIVSGKSPSPDRDVGDFPMYCISAEDDCVSRYGRRDDTDRTPIMTTVRSPLATFPAYNSGHEHQGKNGSYSDPQSYGYSGNESGRYLQKKQGRHKKLQKLTKYPTNKKRDAADNSMDVAAYNTAFEEAEKAARLSGGDILDFLTSHISHQKQQPENLAVKKAQKNNEKENAGFCKFPGNSALDGRQQRKSESGAVEYGQQHSIKLSDSEEAGSSLGSEHSVSEVKPKPKKVNRKRDKKPNQSGKQPENVPIKDPLPVQSVSDDGSAPSATLLLVPGLPPVLPSEQTVVAMDIDENDISHQNVPQTPLSTKNSADALRRSSGSSRSSAGKSAPDNQNNGDADVYDGDKDTRSSNSKNRKKKKKGKGVKTVSSVQKELIDSTRVKEDKAELKYSPSVVQNVSSRVPDVPAHPVQLNGVQSTVDNYSDAEFQLVSRRVAVKTPSPNKNQSAYGHSYNNNNNKYYNNGNNNNRNRSTAKVTKESVVAAVAVTPLEYQALRRRNSAGDLKKGPVDPSPIGGMEISGDISDLDSVRSMPVSNPKAGTGKTTSAPATRLPTPGISYADVAKGTHHSTPDHSAKIVAIDRAPEKAVVLEPIVGNGKTEPEVASVNEKSESAVVKPPETVPETQTPGGKQSVITVEDPSETPPQSLVAVATPLVMESGKSFYPDTGDSTNIHTYETHMAVLQVVKPAPPLAPRVGPVIYQRSQMMLSPVKENRSVKLLPSGKNHHGRGNRHGNVSSAAVYTKDHAAAPLAEQGRCDTNVASQKPERQAQDAGKENAGFSLLNHNEVKAFLMSRFEEARQKCLDGTEGYRYFSTT